MLDKRQGISARIFLLHSKLAVGLSAILFLVCVTGTFSLLRDEIRTWEQAHHNVEALAQAQEFAYVPNDMQDAAITHLLSHFYQSGIAFIESPIYVRLPYAQGDFAKVDYQPLLPDAISKQREWKSTYVQPYALNTQFSPHDYFLSELFYSVHHYLNLPNGEYVVGFSTLFGLLIVASGLVLVWKQRHRIFQRNTQRGVGNWRHWHRRFGLMAFPVAFILFFTGLILTLGIVFQASYAVLLYGGDQEALRADAGYIRTQRNPASDVTVLNNQLAYVDAMRMIPYRLKQAREALAPFQMKYVAAYNLHAQNAVLEVEGFGTESFPQRKRIHIELTSGKVLFETTNTYDNDVRRSLELVHQLHFANFTGVWMKWLYIVLSALLCVLIASGTLVWLARYQKTRQVLTSQIKYWQSFVYGSFTAVFTACTFSIFSARFLPSSEALGYLRGDLVTYVFTVALFIVFAGSFFRAYQFSLRSLQVCQFTLVALLGFELLWLVNHFMQPTISWMLVQDILLVDVMWLLLLIGVEMLKQAIRTNQLTLSHPLPQA